MVWQPDYKSNIFYPAEVEGLQQMTVSVSSSIRSIVGDTTYYNVSITISGGYPFGKAWVWHFDDYVGDFIALNQYAGYNLPYYLDENGEAVIEFIGVSDWITEYKAYSLEVPPVMECEFDSDCPVGEHCYMGECVPNMIPQPDYLPLLALGAIGAVVAVVLWKG